MEKLWDKDFEGNFSDKNSQIIFWIKYFVENFLKTLIKKHGKTFWINGKTSGINILKENFLDKKIRRNFFDKTFYRKNFLKKFINKHRGNFWLKYLHKLLENLIFETKWMKNFKRKTNKNSKK
jgi:hypothetical protein